MSQHPLEPPAHSSETEEASVLRRHLEVSQARFRTAFDQSIMGLVISDIKGTIIDANEAFCRIVGRPVEELVGRTSEHMTHPDDVPQNISKLTQLETGSTRSHSFRKRYLRPDGSLVWTQISISRLPEQAELGETIIATIEDITSEVNARKALADSEQRLRLIFESLHDYGIMTVDVNGIITEWNTGAERLFGYTSAEMLGKDSAPLWTVEDQQRNAPFLEREHARTHGGWQGERWQTRKDGTRFYASGRLRPMFDEAGELIGYAKVCQDVTRRYESDIELAEARAKVAATLQSERDRLAHIFKSSPSFMAVLEGPEHIFVMANDEYYRVVGPRAIIGKSVMEALPELDTQGIKELLDSVYNTGEPFHAHELAIQLRRTDGGALETLYVDFIYQPMRDSNNQITGIFVHGVDQTERLKAQHALNQIAEQRRLALDAAGMGWWHLDVLTGEVFWDDQVKRILGLSSNHLDLESTVHSIEPEDQQSLRNAIASALDVEHPQPYFAEYRVRHADGSIHWVQSKGRAYFEDQPTRHAVRLAGTAMDITEIKEAQEILRINESKFRELADAMPQIVFMAKPDGEVDYFNRQWYEYTGLPNDGETGFEHWKHVHTEEGLAHALELWPHALKTGTPYQIEYKLRRHDGVYRWHLGRALPVRNDKGDIIRWYGTNTDIHDAKMLQQQNELLLTSERKSREDAELANRIKDEFLATLSHELRTPLSAILGWCTILADEPTQEDVKTGLETIERNARAQAQIIDDLLDMSAIISGKIRLHVQNTDIASVVKNAVETVRPAADAKGVRLQMVLDPLARPVSGDPNRLQQILWNLLSNAIKFTPRGGRVQVLLERVNSHLEISVADTGEGIDPEFLPIAFDRFRQADASITRKHGGLGLGLAIVKQLVELHGGSVRVKSLGLGHGATFTVALPLTALHPATVADPERRHPEVSSTPVAIPKDLLKLNGVKVVVVDDEADGRALISRFLEEHQAIVRTAASVDQAMDLIEKEVPDVLVSDIGMPGEDGYSLIRRVRALPPENGGRIPAVALTAYARAEDRMRAIVAGFQMHIAKPAEAAELLTIVSSLAGTMQRPGV